MVKFVSPIAYIPNLGHEKFSAGVDARERSQRSQDDEHRCLSVALAPLQNLYKRGGTNTTVLRRIVKVKVCIYFIIADMQSSNQWVAQYGSFGDIQRPYRDCK